MINEHDIRDMMDQAMGSLTEDERQINFKEEDGELVMVMETFLVNYTKKILEMLQETWRMP